MKIVLKGVAQFVRNRVGGVLVFLIVLLPVAAFSQEPNPDEQDPAEMTAVPAESSPGTNTGSLSPSPWENSAGSTIGTRDNSTNTNPPTEPRPATATSPRSSRPAAGPTTDDRDPSGSPDVPFDNNMNLLFLAMSIVFAVVVVKKRFLIKTVPLIKE